MSTHHGYINEFPWIRVDAFDNARKRPDDPNAAAHVYLLTHCHTDHIVGLDSPNFSGFVYMTEATKNVILSTATAGERVKTEELGTRLKRKFANLLVTAGNKTKHRGADSIRTVTINQPFQIAGPNGEIVTVTALDANHCIGSCMYLIEGSVNGVDKAVLVTGDIRAEDWWTTGLRYNPVVSKYVHWPDRDHATAFGKPEMRARPQLDCIYIDTSSILDEALVSKAEAVDEVCKYIAEYPPSTRFFLNAWTCGYEELLKGISSAFNERIHLDALKLKIYSSPSARKLDPLLASVGTDSTEPLRFHACERKWKCDQVWGDGCGCFIWEAKSVPTLRGPKKLKRPGVDVSDSSGTVPHIVYVNPLEMPVWQWKEYKARMDEVVQLCRRKAQGEELRSEEDALAVMPDYLITPLARHSTLPELQRLVDIFRPRTLYPLTMDVKPGEHCALYPALAGCFRNQLDEAALSRLQQEGADYQQAHISSLGWREQMKLEIERQWLEEYNNSEDQLKTVHGVLEEQKDRNRLYSAATLNVEGRPEAIATINSWLLIKKGERFPPISPVQARRSQLGVTRQGSAVSMSTSGDKSPPIKARSRKLTFGASQEQVVVLSFSDEDEDDELSKMEDDMPMSLITRTQTAEVTLLPALTVQGKRPSLDIVKAEGRAHKKVVVEAEPRAMYSVPASLVSEPPSSSGGETKPKVLRPSAKTRGQRHRFLADMLQMMGNGRIGRDGSIGPSQDEPSQPQEAKHEVLADIHSMSSDENLFAY
ncbi:hypothetical protein ACM66B_002351 [Microbotryomycetes sp. NB124-2]